jgi:Ca2+-binding RTX toxin-like protein
MLLIKGHRESIHTPHAAPLRKVGLPMGRTTLLLATMALTLLVASGVALAVTKIGTNGPDTLRGTNGADNLLGKGANDVLYALGGSDNLLGGEGKDWLLGADERRALGGIKNLVGGPGNDGLQGGLDSDTLLGSSGNDGLFGDKGSDSAVVGGEGRDVINGFTGSDRMLGGGGGGGDFFIDGPLDEASKDDVLSGGDGDDIFLGHHVPAVKDIVSCGSGFDRVMADSKDVVADDCEKVRVVHGTEAEVLDQEDAFKKSLPRAVREFFDAENGFENFEEEQLAPFPAG